VVLLAYTSAEAYVGRYGEADKSGAGSGADDLGLGSSADAWSVPYWLGDAAFGVMSALLAAVDEGLGACMLGNFRGESALAAALGVPDGWRLFGAVALGLPDGSDHRSPSLDRPVPSATERVHRGRW
jgi:nitroreductase